MHIKNRLKEPFASTIFQVNYLVIAGILLMMRYASGASLQQPDNRAFRHEAPVHFQILLGKFPFRTPGVSKANGKDG